MSADVVNPKGSMGLIWGIPLRDKFIYIFLKVSSITITDISLLIFKTYLL